MRESHKHFTRLFLLVLFQLKITFIQFIASLLTDVTHQNPTVTSPGIDLPLPKLQNRYSSDNIEVFQQEVRTITTLRIFDFENANYFIYLQF